MARFLGICIILVLGLVIAAYPITINAEPLLVFLGLFAEAAIRGLREFAVSVGTLFLVVAVAMGSMKLIMWLLGER